MKKMSIWMMALMLTIALSSCAVMNSYMPHEETVSPPGAAEIPTPVPEATQTPVATAEPEHEEEKKTTLELGNLTGNLSAGGHIAMTEAGQLFVAREDGIYACVGDEFERISSDKAHHLNVWQDRLIYVSMVETEPGRGTEAIVSVKQDGSERTVLAEEKPVAREIRYGENDTIESSYFTGYTDLIVVGDDAYYIAANGKSSTKTMYAEYVDETYEVTGYSEKSIYRLPLAGGEAVELVPDLGNGDAHFTVGNDKIFYTTCEDSGADPYPIVTFNQCNLDGSDAELLYGIADTTDQKAVNEIVNSMFTANDMVFVSASDSEGDFPHGRLMALKGDYYEFWGDETFHVNATADEQGQLYSLFTDGQVQGIVDDDGVWIGEYIENARIIRSQTDGSAADYDTLHTFARLNRFGDEFSTFELYVFGDQLFLLTDAGLHTLDTENPHLTQIWDAAE